MNRRWLFRWALVGALLLPGVARAGSLTDGEKARLDRGEVVTRTFDVDLPGGDYMGGLAYVVIPAPPAEVMAIFLDPASYGRIFPLTQEARLAGRAGDDWFVYIRQGGRRASGEYTVRVRRETPSLVRFWMDPGRPHDIGDCWGFFRVDPAGDGRTLLTYGALLHLEFGVIKLLFAEKIRSYALETPALVRRYVEERRSGPVSPRR